MSSNDIMVSSTPPSSNSGPKAKGSSLCKNYANQPHMNTTKGHHAGRQTNAIPSNRDTSTPPNTTGEAPPQLRSKAPYHTPNETPNDTPNDTHNGTHNDTHTNTHINTHNSTQPEPQPGNITRNYDLSQRRRSSGRRESSFRSESSVGSNHTDNTEGSNTSENSDMLNFAKRDISTNIGRASYSQLSTLTQNSPEHLIEPVTSVSEEPVYQADDHVRITNPASAALSRMPGAEQIGFHEPFGDNSRSNSRSGSTSSSGHSPKTGIQGNDGSASSNSGSSGGNTSTTTGNNNTTNTTNTNPNGVDDASGLLSTRTSPTTLQPYVPKRDKPYEPARVVLHRSELNAPYGTSNPGGGGSSSDNSDNSSTLKNSQSAVSLPARNGSSLTLNCSHLSLNGLRGSSVSDIVSPSLVRSLAGSPEGHSINGPIKHIREPKQPIYIPAVLRPTEEAAYETGSPHGNTSQGPISSSSTLPGSAAVLHSQKPVTRHWVPDRNAKKCNSCDRDFTWYRRRHHCRKCGGVFCADDASKTIGLDRLLNFNVLGMPCKACDKCAADFAAFCLDSPRLNDNALTMQQPVAGPETEELEIGGGGDWSTF